MARYVPKHRRKPPPRRRALVSGASLLVAAASAVTGAVGFVPAVQAQNPFVVERAQQQGADASARSVHRSAAVATPLVRPAIDAKTAREPAFIDLPAIETTSSLIPLGLNPDGTLEVPVDFGQAGWYARGPAPGEKGPAVIAGHVDSYRGPAVFSRLDKLKPGDAVRIARVDGVRIEYRVTRVDRYPKDYFPTDQVYGPTQRPELRLITCGGTFDASTGSYRDNTVVYAQIV